MGHVYTYTHIDIFNYTHIGGENRKESVTYIYIHTRFSVYVKVCVGHVYVYIMYIYIDTCVCGFTRLYGTGVVRKSSIKQRYI